jgi:serine/threonine-protein kinase
MSAAHEPAGASLSEPWKEREALIGRFEAAWLGGGRPAIADYLPAAGAERQAVLVELVHAELECRLKAGEAARAEDYLARFPELAADPNVVRSLAAAERRLRPDPEPLPPAGQPAAGEAPTLPPGAPLPDGRHPRGRGVPGYEILGELGRGGMGVVYKATQVALHRTVALKMILSGDHAGPEERLRFLAEAEAVAAIGHPGIVQVYDFGTHDGLPFFALEFCPGGSLADRLAGNPLPAREAAALVETLARAVQAAHQAGVVHRDLKPQNVLLGADGTPKVTDFGLAKRVEGGSGLTQTGAILGTPSYMAPEQASGSKEIGPAADVWSLGAILYECFTGRPPFRAATAMDTILQVISDDPVPPSRLVAKLPPDLETITLKCLQKAPQARYASAAALAHDLANFQEGRPIAARPVSFAERLWRWARRNRGLAAAAGVAVLALVLGSAVSTAFGIRATVNERQARDEARRADENAAEADRARAEEARRRKEVQREVLKLTLARG